MRSGSTVQRKESDRRTEAFPHQGGGADDALAPAGLEHTGALSGTLLDIGSGIGSLTFGLLERGITRAVAVDASSAYNGVARQEAARLGRTDVVRFVHADFVSVAPELPAATVVTLDRVVCCYPSYEALLNAAAHHAQQRLALSYPRDVWYVRLGVMLENAHRRLKKNPFRTFVHPAARMEELIRSAGFEPSTRQETWMWSVDVYTRTEGIEWSAARTEL
jgi:magnesium-protoporphyrin O-methyltransferase